MNHHDSILSRISKLELVVSVHCIVQALVLGSVVAVVVVVGKWVCDVVVSRNPERYTHEPLSQQTKQIMLRTTNMRLHNSINLFDKINQFH